MRAPAHGDWAALAWAGIAALIFGYVLAYDLWAHFTKHLTMTHQFRDWLHDPIMGPVMFALWIAVPVGLTYHFIVTK